LSFFAAVEEMVRDYAVGDVAVKRWRLALTETVRSELGIESNRAGSPYRPLTISETGGGRFLLEWTDGTISKGSLTRAPREALEDSLRSAFEGRYDDPDEANFPGPAEVPETAIFSPETAAIADGTDAEALPAILEEMKAARERHGAKILDAGAQGARGRRLVVSSGGFRAEERSTVFGFSAAFDSLVWDGFRRREPVGAEEARELVERTAADYASLRETAPDAPRGPTEIVLHPRVAEGFLDTFLFPNLSGSAVSNGRSRFSADDFREGRRVFREDLRISTRTTVPLGVGSFCFTDEGVPARDLDLVAGGRLVTPTLGLKYARRMDMKPAPVPGSVEGYRFGLSDPLPREEALRADAPRVLVHSVMGLHTQDAARGEYSLLAPQCTLYADGEPAGRISATLNGSFFEDLTSDALRLVDFPGFGCPGLLVTAELS